MAERAGSLERLRGRAQALVLDPQRITELRSCQPCPWGQAVEDLLLDAPPLALLELGDDL
jgi:hypothetical protein